MGAAHLGAWPEADHLLLLLRSDPSLFLPLTPALASMLLSSLVTLLFLSIPDPFKHKQKQIIYEEPSFTMHP